MYCNTNSVNSGNIPQDIAMEMPVEGVISRFKPGAGYSMNDIKHVLIMSHPATEWGSQYWYSGSILWFGCRSARILWGWPQHSKTEAPAQQTGHNHPIRWSHPLGIIATSPVVRSRTVFKMRPAPSRATSPTSTSPSSSSRLLSLCPHKYRLQLLAKDYTPKQTYLIHRPKYDLRRKLGAKSSFVQQHKEIRRGGIIGLHSERFELGMDATNRGDQGNILTLRVLRPDNS